MDQNVYQGWVRRALAVFIITVMLALPAQALAHDPGSGGASQNDINDLFNITFWISVPIFLLVEGLLIFAIIRYRRRKTDEMPEQVEGYRPLEIGWTVFASVIVLVLFIITYRALQSDYKAGADGNNDSPYLTVNVDAYMFNWDYHYFLGDDTETKVTTTRTLTLPAQQNVLLKITSRDVQHSFWVPELAGKVDAVPGHTNTMWLNIDKAGTYTGNCAEFCGRLHYDMLIDVTVLEPADFDAWLADEIAATSEFVPVGTDLEIALPPGDAAQGELKFNELNCAACHGTQAGVGPGLTQIAEDAEERGDEADAYLHESIVLPCDYETPGYSCAIMPADYGTKLDAQQLADVIEYLKSFEE